MRFDSPAQATFRRALADCEVAGFRVRVYPSGRKIYVVQSRGPGGSKRITLGRHGELTVEQARKQAVAVIDRIKRGENPVAAPPEPAFTVADLAERYLETHVAVNCNAHTAGIYRGSLDNHILPALGAMPITLVGPPEAAALHYGLRDTPRAANRALMVLSKMFSLAEDWGLAPAGGNPCRFVRKYKEGMRERFLTPVEYRRLGRVLCSLDVGGDEKPRLDGDFSDIGHRGAVAAWFAGGSWLGAAVGKQPAAATAKSLAAAGCLSTAGGRLDSCFGWLAAAVPRT